MPPVDQQPTQPPAPTSTPVVPQPSPSAQSFTGGVTPLTQDNIEKQKKLARTLIIISAVLLVVGLLVGFASAAGAVLGAYALSIGIRTKSTPLKIGGAVTLGLNFTLFTVATILNIMS